MGPVGRFLIGGGGAMMPVFVSILAIDVGAFLDNDGVLTTGNIIGLAIRYMILFTLGGTVACLHNDEIKPFKLFELGIAAPALITSIVTAQGMTGLSYDASNVEALKRNQFSVVSSAHADTNQQTEPVLLYSNLLGDIYKGISGDVYKDVNKERYKRKKAPQREDAKADQDKKAKKEKFKKGNAAKAGDQKASPARE